MAVSARSLQPRWSTPRTRRGSSPRRRRATAWVVLMVVMAALVSLAPIGSSSAAPSPAEQYQLTKIGKASSTPAGSVLVAAAAPALLLQQGDDLDPDNYSTDNYYVWRAGTTRLLPRRPGRWLGFFAWPSINGLGEVIGIQPTRRPMPADVGTEITRWSRNGTPTKIGSLREYEELGFLTDSGAVLSVRETTSRRMTGVRIDRDGTRTTLFRNIPTCVVHDMSENSVVVGECHEWTTGTTTPFLNGMPVSLDLPPKDPQYRTHCLLRSVSPRARYVSGHCSFVADSADIRPPTAYWAMWSTATGRRILESTSQIIDVDDRGRALLRGDEGVVSLWVNGTTTALSRILRLNSRQGPLYPRFDANSGIVTIVPTPSRDKVLGQAWRITRR